MASWSNIESLPEDCVSRILSCVSPPEACTFSLVSSTLRSAADSDIVWKTFLPSDYEDIVSRAIHPSTLQFSSYKQLFFALCHPLLLDGGNKSFELDKYSGKKSYILSARELSIAWSSDPMIWAWKPVPESRFPEVVELRTVSWLEIEGRIKTGILTPNTLYGAYLIMNVSQRAYGLDFAPSEVSVAVGEKVHRRRACLGQKDDKKRAMESLFYGNRREVLLMEEEEGEGIWVPRKRDDGWMEIEMGEFLSGEGDEEIKMSLKEVGYQLKGGLVLEGIQVRPKTCVSPKLCYLKNK
ncbi:hypothetical protein RJT34_19145 [Clitoria ternatea]|uniref:F-box domain-containing protein n=1 Tax=Clitoria ternatea TaxID=43366 RepID=A0AAN9IQH8_CLITE